MPKLTDNNLEQHVLATNQYGFSATKLDNLGATEYTLGTIVVDSSPSTAGFVREMEKACKEILKACKFSPRADNLMLRTVQFNTVLSEMHGFKLLSEINEVDYDNVLRPQGGTALFDAAENGIGAVAAYANTLSKNDYQTNGILFVITDGEDNSSKLTTNSVKKQLEDIARSESLESFITVLIGVNVQNPYVKQALRDFNTEVGFTKYIELENADAKTLAKLADFISKSISAQSQALGTGGPSQSLAF